MARKKGKELKIKSSYTVSPSTSGEDHFTFQCFLHSVAGKNVFTEHLTKQVFCPLLFSSKLSVMNESAFYQSWEENLHILAGSHITLRSVVGPSHPHWEIPLTLRKQLPSKGCGIRRWKCICNISFLEGKKEMSSRNSLKKVLKGFIWLMLTNSWTKQIGFKWRSWTRSPADLRETTGKG